MRRMLRSGIALPLPLAALLAITLAALLAAAGCGKDDRLDPPPIAPSLQAELETWLAEHGRPPADYVMGLFADHDVVLLGEQHRFRHDALLVQALIPRLRAAGVNVLATEFARRDDQALIDSLVTAPAWHEDLGREIIFRQFMAWGFREYVDILEAAWRANRDRPAGAPPLRVLGVNHSLDYSQFRTDADREDPAVWRRVMGGQTEADWAVPVLAAVERGEKVLAHCGIHHAFTGFRQPRVAGGAFKGFGELRFGNHLREALGDRAVTVYLHAPWNTAAGYDAVHVHPADGRLDAFMLARDGGPFAVGFDTAPSPLGDLPIANAVYMHGHEPFTMAAFCDGWIYIEPVGDSEPVAYIADWIKEGNLESARAAAMNPRWRGYTVEQMNAGCRSYLTDHERFYGRLR
jgi:hypothetical protein